MIRPETFGSRQTPTDASKAVCQEDVPHLVFQKSGVPVKQTSVEKVGLESSYAKFNSGVIVSSTGTISSAVMFVSFI
jgi:hypothetical protein